MEKTLYFKKENFRGNLEALEIPLERIHEIRIKKKHVNKEKIKTDLIGDFLLTILNARAHPEPLEYESPTIIIDYFS